MIICLRFWPASPAHAPQQREVKLSAADRELTGTQAVLRGESLHIFNPAAPVLGA